MAYMDRYSDAELPVAEKVLFDLAVFHVVLACDRLKNLVALYPTEGIDDKEVTDIADDIVVAERILRMAENGTGPYAWPWDSDDFQDFWSLGGDAREAESMVTYLEQMPQFFRTYLDAQKMPTEYGQALLDGIPRWHN